MLTQKNTYLSLQPPFPQSLIYLPVYRPIGLSTSLFIYLSLSCPGLSVHLSTDLYLSARAVSDYVVQHGRCNGNPFALQKIVREGALVSPPRKLKTNLYLGLLTERDLLPCHFVLVGAKKLQHSSRSCRGEPSGGPNDETKLHLAKLLRKVLRLPNDAEPAALHLAKALRLPRRLPASAKVLRLRRSLCLTR